MSVSSRNRQSRGRSNRDSSESSTGNSGRSRSGRGRRSGGGRGRGSGSALTVLMFICFSVVCAVAGVLYAGATQWHTFVTPDAPHAQVAVTVAYPNGWRHQVMPGWAMDGTVVVEFTHPPLTGPAALWSQYVLRSDTRSWSHDRFFVRLRPRAGFVNINAFASAIQRGSLHRVAHVTASRIQHRLGPALDLRFGGGTTGLPAGSTMRRMLIFPDATPELRKFYIEVECKGESDEAARLQPVFTRVLENIRLIKGV